MDHTILELETIDNPVPGALNALAVALNKAAIDGGDGPLVGLVVLGATDRTLTYDHAEHQLLNEADLIDRCIVTLQRRKDQIEVEGETT
jgi:hypothetical protein